VNNSKEEVSALLLLELEEAAASQCEAVAVGDGSFNETPKTESDDLKVNDDSKEAKLDNETGRGDALNNVDVKKSRVDVDQGVVVEGAVQFNSGTSRRTKLRILVGPKDQNKEKEELMASNSSSVVAVGVEVEKSPVKESSNEAKRERDEKAAVVSLSPVMKSKRSKAAVNKECLTGSIGYVTMPSGVGDNYGDTIQRVQVIGNWDNQGSGEWECRLLAFDPDHDNFIVIVAVEELHDAPGRLFGEHDELRAGMEVHFLFKNRKVNGEAVDGYDSKCGVWVKGIVVCAVGDFVEVSCTDWAKKNVKDDAEQRLLIPKKNVMLPWL
jgi:hypothetical protein